ncbi:hypothetical protein predicted by Glimmer/Critica (plasmid) [Sinorhizobium fredii HH103]|uniref:Uncharacterized protein n=1 Tax=Sinorhizobium fredii (strain HH103) TaxID=1117943 RepID=G9AIF4_SINF1|nr:hypothetical protein predicted by Glimmer/Critica [Sinorhizobium fredii HH103]
MYFGICSSSIANHNGRTVVPVPASLADIEGFRF